MISLLKTITKKMLLSPSLIIALLFALFFISFVPGSFFAPTTGGPPSTIISDADIQLKTEIVASIIITGFLIIVMTSFYEAYIKIKKSLIYTTLRLNHNSKIQFAISVFLPIILLSIIYFILIIIYVLIADNFGVIGGSNFDMQKNIINWSNINWLMIIVSLLMTSLLGISIALLISQFTDNLNIYISIVWGYLFLIFFFGGSSVPIFLIRGNNSLDAFKYISYSIPNVWCNFLFIESFTGNFTFKETISMLNFVIPISTTLLFFGISFFIEFWKNKR